jgi:hypothetical protein
MRDWIMEIDGPTLRHHLERLFPEPSSARYARFLGIRQKSLHRFLDGERVFDATPDQIDDFDIQAASMKETDFVAKLDAVLMEAGRGGVHPEIIAAWLAYAYKKETGRAVE